MGIYFTPTIYVPVILALLGTVGYFFYTRYRRKHGKPGGDKPGGDDKQKQGKELTEPEDVTLTARVYQNKPLPARIIDDVAVTPDMQKDIIKRCATLGQIRDHYGKKILVLYKNDEGNLCPMPIPAVVIKAHPRKLYNDIRQPAAAIFYDMSEEKNFFEKWGKLLVWVAIMAFIMFMVISTIRG